MKNEQKSDLKFVIVFILILTLSTLYLSKDSFARYRKQTSVEVNANIAKWNIKVNNEDISNKVTLTNSITPTFTNNEFVKDTVIAPGSKGYCDILIDASNVDVDFTYELTSSMIETSAIKDLKISSYIINPSETNTTEIPYNSTESIKGNIQKNTNNTSIRLYILWDEETGTMDNIEDTKVALNTDSKALINIKLKFEQKTN